MACCNSALLHVANDAVAEVPANGNVPLGTTVCQLGCRARLNGDGVVLAPGTYLVAGTVTLAPTTATEADSGTTVSVALRSGGGAVQGGTVSADAAGAVTLPVCVTVCAPRGTTLTLANVGDAVSVTGVSVVVIPA